VVTSSLYQREIPTFDKLLEVVAETGGRAMRVFIVACIVAGIIAAGAAVTLDGFVQESSSAAFTEPSARI
jgi:NaMN:DMB phosphoribosyltransferase